MKKQFKILLFIIVLFIIFLIFYLTPKNYELEYQIDGIDIKEEYHKENNYYEISLKYQNEEYKYVTFDKYSKSRKIINNIDTFSDEDYICLIMESDIIKTYPLCKKGNENIDYHLVNELKNDISSNYYKVVNSNKNKYKNLDINYLDNKIYLIWNYNGIYLINKDEFKTIDVFDKDVYDISLAFLWNNNFVIPNYADEFYFDKFYIYNLVDNELYDWKLKNPIYFDSYLLGFYDKSVFIFDRKQNKEYELVPHKKKIRSVSPKILNKNEWNKVSTNKLRSQSLSFGYDEIISYNIKNNKLYMIIDDYEILLSCQNVKDIVYYNNNEVYYLVDDTLYKYNLEYGEIKIMSCFEWNFNYKNMIFVY